jgi:hypothetical protein
MVQGDFDRELLLFVPFSLGTAASLGLIQTNILPFIDLGQTLLSTGTIDWTIGRGLAVAALAGVLINRDASLLETGGVDAWIAWATLGFLLAPPFLPAFADTLAQQPAATISFSVQSLGFGLVSWSN